MPIVLITPPAIEPVTLADLKLQCGLSPVEDTDHVKEQMVAQQLRRYIRGARAMCENFTRRVFVTQTWQLLLDGWPHIDRQYHQPGQFSIVVPKPPFQSLSSFTYVDTQGVVQDMAGWGFQTDPGGETQPARLTPPYLMPWPPIRQIPNNVAVTFKCGYGGPVTVTTAANSTVLTGPVWNPGDVGRPISIPGAGIAGVLLTTTIAAVSLAGQATLATAASGTVTNATAYAGVPVPEPILDAILLLAQYMYDGNALKEDPPKFVQDALGPYVNRVA